MFVFLRNRRLQIARRYIEAANANDLKAVGDMIPEDFAFVDNAGTPLVGKQQNLAAIARLHRIAPGFRIEIAKMSVRGSNVLVKGRSTSEEPRLNTDTQWRLTIEGGKVVEVQSFGPEILPSLSRMLGED